MILFDTNAIIDIDTQPHNLLRVTAGRGLPALPQNR
jgi:hypothetical protein